MIYKFFIDWANFYVNGGSTYIPTSGTVWAWLSVSKSGMSLRVSFIVKNLQKCGQSIVQNLDGLTRKFKHNLPTPDSSL